MVPCPKARWPRSEGEPYNRKLADVLVLQEEIARQITERLRLRLSGEEQKRLAKRYTENTEAKRGGAGRSKHTWRRSYRDRIYSRFSISS